ncbi:hypothetical protein EYC84_006760 [Monilinia fructicola]|uniref:Uncharacterized protein n=1 Tax=Monilinia fructicola TaxID=38448 RepID=A0A5M9K857_MONFR|nr:hypothetical protein EYC84_006760 [Monilinia fructicola]
MSYGGWHGGICCSTLTFSIAHIDYHIRRSGNNLSGRLFGGFQDRAEFRSHLNFSSFPNSYFQTYYTTTNFPF